MLISPDIGLTDRPIDAPIDARRVEPTFSDGEPPIPAWVTHLTLSIRVPPLDTAALVTDALISFFKPFPLSREKERERQIFFSKKRY